MAKAGLFRLWIPRALGGEEADPMTLVRAVEEVSRADGAAGWCLAIGGEYGAFGGYLPKDAAREIYGSDPLVVTGGRFVRLGKLGSRMADTASPGGGHWEAVATIARRSSAAFGFWTAISRASGPNGAPVTRILFFPARDGGTGAN